MSEATKQEAKPAMSLVRKLAEVMGEVERVAKNGRNNFHNYDYATESDIAAAVRKEMSDRRLILVPSVEKTEWEVLKSAKGGDKKLCTLTVKYRLMDGDSGEQMEFTMLGQGEDQGDKATYKAMTGATKYALMKLFLMPTGDDPEKDSEHRFVPAREEQADKPPPKSKSTLPGSSMVMKFGEGRGKAIADLTDTELHWQIDAVNKSVIAKDPKWHKLNLDRQAALNAESQVRISSGKIAAPATTSPRQAELPVDGEATPYQRMAQLGRMHKLTAAQVFSRAKGVCGKDGGWTAEDVEKVSASLVAVPAVAK